MRTTKKPVTKTDVTRAMATIEANIKELVRLLGDPDDDVSEEASRMLLQIGEPAVEPLAGAIRRPCSPVHRIRAIFAIRFIHPRNSLAAQLALLEVEKREKDEPILNLASAVLLELTLDEVENKAIESRRHRWIEDFLTPTTTESHAQKRNQLVKERLSELRTQE